MSAAREGRALILVAFHLTFRVAEPAGLARRLPLLANGVTDQGLGERRAKPDWSRQPGVMRSGHFFQSKQEPPDVCYMICDIFGRIDTWSIKTVETVIHFLNHKPKTLQCG
ncbi:MAG: hypothetical protein JW384_00296 [Nitrosomonadaceae bacterium]|nr:hypothetical protein [Nitrosomonadaceae bacterium]